MFSNVQIGKFFQRKKKHYYKYMYVFVHMKSSFVLNDLYFAVNLFLN